MSEAGCLRLFFENLHKYKAIPADLALLGRAKTAADQLRSLQRVYSQSLKGVQLANAVAQELEELETNWKNQTGKPSQQQQTTHFMFGTRSLQSQLKQQIMNMFVAQHPTKIHQLVFLVHQSARIGLALRHLSWRSSTPQVRARVRACL